MRLESLVHFVGSPPPTLDQCAHQHCIGGRGGTENGTFRRTREIFNASDWPASRNFWRLHCYACVRAVAETR